MENTVGQSWGETPARLSNFVNPRAGQAIVFHELRTGRRFTLPKKRLSRQRFPEIRNSQGGKPRREAHRCSLTAVVLASSGKSQRHGIKSVLYLKVQQTVSAGSNLCLESVNLLANRSQQSSPPRYEILHSGRGRCMKGNYHAEQQICSAMKQSVENSEFSASFTCSSVRYECTSLWAAEF